MLQELTKETLDLLQQVQAGEFGKVTNQATGLVNYDLRPVAATLVPVITPFRNKIRRVPGNGDTATRWKAITSYNINNTRAGVSEGKRGGLVDITVANYTAAYAGIGLEGAVTFEATYADDGFDDAKARGVIATLRSLMVAEERMLLDGNTSLALGTTPTPTLAVGGTGATVPTQTTSVICVALTPEGFRNAPAAPAFTGGITASIVRTNADATSDTFGGGVAQKSAAATVGTTLGQHVFAAVTPVKGAFAYAWYWGVAGAELLGAITPLASVDITAVAGGTQNASALPAADNSRNGLIFDGFATQSLNTATAYYKAMPNVASSGVGTGLSSDGAGGIVEIDAVFQYFWNTSRFSPSWMLVNAQELINISKKVLVNGSSPLVHFNLDPKMVSTGLIAGLKVAGYLNRFSMGGAPVVDIMLHPDVPPGTIYFGTDDLPYALDIPGVMQVKTRRDYYQTEWPVTTRQYTFGVYADEVLQVFAPFTLGVLTNIGNV